jgi:ABC-type branched-subunit amino acid transport system ATPase component
MRRTQALRKRTVVEGSERALTVRGIVKDFGGVRALDGVDMELEPAEVLGLIGPNGSGKTTLVNCISGQLRADRGTVCLAGKDVTRSGPRGRARLGIARTFQTPRLFPELTVAENVEVGLSAATGRRTNHRHGVEALLERMGLTDSAREAVVGLPYGLQRRVELARVLAGRPSFLLLDEPAAGLNDHETAALLLFIREVVGQFRCGVLLIDHDMALMMKASDRVHVLDEGRVIFRGAPDEAFRQDHVVEAYLGVE